MHQPSFSSDKVIFVCNADSRARADGTVGALSKLFRTPAQTYQDFKSALQEFRAKADVCRAVVIESTLDLAHEVISAEELLEDDKEGTNTQAIVLEVCKHYIEGVERKGSGKTEDSLADFWSPENFYRTVVIEDSPHGIVVAHDLGSAVEEYPPTNPDFQTSVHMAQLFARPIGEIPPVVPIYIYFQDAASRRPSQTEREQTGPSSVIAGHIQWGKVAKLEFV